MLVAVLGPGDATPATTGRRSSTARTSPAGTPGWAGRTRRRKSSASTRIRRRSTPSSKWTANRRSASPARSSGPSRRKKEYENYHFKLEFKWGEKTLAAAREGRARQRPALPLRRPARRRRHLLDASQELQIQEKDCGDYWSVAGGIVDVEGRAKTARAASSTRKAARSSPCRQETARIIKNPDNEKPTGEWNTIELMAVGGTSVHIVNGKVNMVLTNSRHIVDGKEDAADQGQDPDSVRRGRGVLPQHCRSGR